MQNTGRRTSTVRNLLNTPPVARPAPRLKLLRGTSGADCESPEFLAKLRAGDHQAFLMLDRVFRKRLLAMAKRIVRNADEAEDVIQDTFLATFEKLHSFEGRSKLSSWIFSVANNAALSRLRKKANHELSFDEPLSSDYEHAVNVVSEPTAPTGEDHVLQAELREQLRAAVAALPDGYRQMFVLKELRYVSIRDIAGAYGIRPGAVKTRLHRARKMMRPELVAYLEGAP